jgi:hypothetical protein
LITEDYLRAAAATIDQASDADLECKLSQLKEAHRARSPLKVARQQANLDSLESGPKAYRLARQAHDEGDLVRAARFYHESALEDFADASLRLAEVLYTLAQRRRAALETGVATCEEVVALLLRAAHWYEVAYGAGEIEAAGFLDDLVACLASLRLSRPADAAPTDAKPSAHTCPTDGSCGPRHMHSEDIFYVLYGPDAISAITARPKGPGQSL